MTMQQEAHRMIDGLNNNGLNYIIGILRDLDASNWTQNMEVIVTKPKTKSTRKLEAAQRLRDGRKKYENVELTDPHEALIEGLTEKYGGTLS